MRGVLSVMDFAQLTRPARRGQEEESRTGIGALGALHGRSRQREGREGRKLESTARGGVGTASSIARPRLQCTLSGVGRCRLTTPQLLDLPSVPALRALRAR